MLDNIISNILYKIKSKNNFDIDIANINKYIELLISRLYFYEEVNYLNKGKKLRSLLALYYYYKYRNTNSYDINTLYEILAIVELTHFASLMHDDVIDNNKYRRNEKSFNCMHGNKNAILVGDYLLIKIFNNLLQVLNYKYFAKYIINQFIKASADTAYGAYLENNLLLDNINCSVNKINTIIEYNTIQNKTTHYNNLNLENNNNLINKYIKIAKLKTGSLFKFSCIAGSILSNTNFNNLKQASIFGLLFGVIYQIQDDINDYNCNNYTESEDYMQSNITFPIIILNNIVEIKSILYNKNQNNFNKIKELINSNKFKNTIEYYIKLYRHILYNNNL